MYFLVNKKKLETITKGVLFRISSCLAIIFFIFVNELVTMIKIKIELNPMIFSGSQMPPSAGELNKD